MSVFITSARSKAVLSAIRSIGKQKIRVVAGDVYKNSIGFCSKYCFKSFLYPSPENEKIFIDSLYRVVKGEGIEVLIPGHDDTTYVISKYKELFEDIVTVPIPDMEVLVKAYDKYKTILSAEEIGIPVPKTYHVENEKDLRKLLKEVSYPLVIKPRFQNKGYGAYGVAYVYSSKELLRIYSKISFNDYVIQEFIPGGSEKMRMVNALFDKRSHLVAIFTAKKHRSHPITGGSTTLGESIWDPKLAELGMKLLKAWRWYGLAEIEFKLDPRDGELKLIEVNPRFWTYIDLPIACGVDFPYLLYKIATGERVKFMKKYRIGVKFVNPIADPLAAFKILMKSKDKIGMFRDLIMSYMGEKTYELLSFEDPKPFLCEILWNLCQFPQLNMIRKRI